MKVLRNIGLLFLMVLFLTSVLTYAQNPAKENYDKGVEYAIQGEFPKAKEEFEKALKVDPFFNPAELSLKTIKDVIEQKIKREAAIHLFKGASYANKSLYDQAISDYTKALEINPKYANAYINQGNAYRKKGQYDQAVNDYTKAIEINPKDANAYYNRGNAYVNKGLYYHAISDFTKAIEINPKLAKAYDNRGFLYFVKLDNKAKSCADFKKACELGECGNYTNVTLKGYCP